MKQFVFALVLLFTQSASALKLIDVLRKRAQELGICENYLTAPHYKIDEKTFGQKIKPTLAPEPGSIEDRSPGLIRELILIRMAILDLDKEYFKVKLMGDTTKSFYERSDYLEFPKQLEKFRKNLELHFNKHSAEPRLLPLLTSSQQKFEVLVTSFDNNQKPSIAAIKTRMQILTSGIWEIIVACLFAGEKIYLDKYVSELYPEEFEALKLGRSKRPQYDRELDIAILNKDGSWRWIEVKDWNPKSAANEDSRQSLYVQANAQNETRQLFPQKKIQLDLVMKYGPSLEDYLLLAVETQFNNIYFIFPDGLDESAVLVPGDHTHR